MHALRSITFKIISRRVFDVNCGVIFSLHFQIWQLKIFFDFCVANEENWQLKINFITYGFFLKYPKLFDSGVMGYLGPKDVNFN